MSKPLHPEFIPPPPVPQSEIFIPPPSQTLLKPIEPKKEEPKKELAVVPRASTPEIYASVIKIQFDANNIILETSGWSHLYEDAREAAYMLLELYQYKSYDLPRIAERSDNQFRAGIRADGKNDTRVLESRGLVESPPWGDPVPDILTALIDPTTYTGALLGAQISEKRFSAALRGGLNLTLPKSNQETSVETQAQASSQIQDVTVEAQRKKVML